MGSEELARLLRRIEEKLYAGWNLYIALSFLYWIPVLNIYMAIISTSWYHNMSEYGQAIVDTAYWGVAVVLSFASMYMLVKRYIVRLVASYGDKYSDRRRRTCNRLLGLFWLSGVAVSWLLYDYLGQVFGVERADAAWLLLFITIGTTGCAAAEYCASRKLSPSIVAPLATAIGLLLLPFTPPSEFASYTFASAMVTAGYSMAVILYVLAALRRLG